MKKAAALMMTGLILLTLTACKGAKESNPYEQYTDSIKVFTEADSYHTQTDMNLKISAVADEENENSFLQNLNQDIKLSVDLKAKGQDLEMKTTQNIAELGGDTHIFYKDGYVYSPTDKTKQKQDLNIAGTIMGLVPQSGSAEEFKEIVKEAKTEKDGENQKLIFMVDGEKIADSINPQALNSLMGNGDGAGLNDVEVIATINPKNELQGLDMNFDMDMNIQELQFKVDIHMNMNVLQTGDIEIEFPEDLDSYKE